jgi:hypothetical protein
MTIVQLLLPSLRCAVGAGDAPSQYTGNAVNLQLLRAALLSRQDGASFLVKAGTDPKTIQDSLRWADPSILLRTYAQSRLNKRREAPDKMVAGVERIRSAPDSIAVSDAPWVILWSFHHQGLQQHALKPA